MTELDDITETLAPKSDQLDNIELTPEGRIFTVERVEVKRGAEQPVRVHLVDFPRPWKPGVTMRRVLGHCWGKKSSLWTGRRVHLYRDPDISYGKDKTGGTRIRALSHIDGPMDAPVLLSQGRSGTYHVEPLTEEAPTTTEPDPLTIVRDRVLALARGRFDSPEGLKAYRAEHGIGWDDLAALTRLADAWEQGDPPEALAEPA